MVGRRAVLPVGEVVAAIEALEAIIVGVSDKFEGRRSVESGGSSIIVKLHERKGTADLTVYLNGGSVRINSCWRITSSAIPRIRPSGMFLLADPEFESKFGKFFYEFFDHHYNPLKRS